MNRSRLVVGLTAVLLSGCMLPSFSAFPPGIDPIPTKLATYSAGSASIELTQSGTTETITLVSVGPGSTLNSLSGATVSWRNEDGWILLVTAYDLAAFSAFGRRPSAQPTRESGSGPENQSYFGEVTVERIDGHEFWQANGSGATGNRCIVDVTDVGPELISGKATCRGLRWSDGAVPLGIGDPVFIEGQDPFDAEITFEARP